MTLWESQRPRPPKPRGTPKDKQGRYRAKCLALNLCPHCGKPTGEYAECQKRRIDKRLGHILSQLVKSGEIVRVKRGLYQKTAKFIPSPAHS